jgi:hypothetical protein
MIALVALLIDYFLASSDEQARAVIDWPGGPGKSAPKKGLFGRPHTPGLPMLEGPGVEPVVNLGMFEELLTGRTFDEQLGDPLSRVIVANRDGGERLVIRIGDGFISAIADSDPNRLQELATPWSQIEEFYGQADPADLSRFLLRLRELAAQATSSNQHVYCWICV